MNVFRSYPLSFLTLLKLNFRKFLYSVSLPIKLLTKFHTHGFGGCGLAVNTLKHVYPLFTTSINYSKTHYVLKPFPRLGQFVSVNCTKIR